MDKLMTREQWEALREEEMAAHWNRSREAGDIGATLCLSGAEQDRFTPEQLASLIDAKLHHLKLGILEKVAERRARQG